LWLIVALWCIFAFEWMKRSRQDADSDKRVVRICENTLFYHYGTLEELGWWMALSTDSRKVNGGVLKVLEFRSCYPGMFACIDGFDPYKVSDSELDPDLQGIYDSRSRMFYLPLHSYSPLVNDARSEGQPPSSYLALVDDDKRPDKTQMFITDIFLRK
jgi:hypothetical protein